MMARYEETQRTLLYETYTTDSLRYLLESVTKAFGGRLPSNRYAEIIGLIPGEETEQEPEKKADEIINKFMADLGGNKQ